jgi:hypothetical protein
MDLEQGNHSVFDYTRQFNTLAQYGTYHSDMDEKKANLCRARLTIHLQERLVHLSSMSYNELAIAAIDQERMMKAVAETDEKKRKMMMPGSASSGSSIGAPPKYRMVYTPPGGQLCRPQQQQNWGHHPQFQPRQFQQQQPQHSNSNGSTVPLLHRCSRLPSGHHSSFPLATFHASTMG